MASSHAPTVPSLGNALRHAPADKRIEILRRVGECGSISQAARDAGVSYKAAWQAIDTLTNLAGVELVERAVGGSGGGGASLTEAGQKLLTMADLVSKTLEQVFTSFSANELALRHALPPALLLLSHFSVRTSMRNLLPCSVQKVVVQGQMVRIGLRLPGASGGSLLVSRITKASAELLGLKKDQDVLALCKATAVQVSALQADLPQSSIQNLPGKAVRVSRGATGDEVSMLLDSGLQLVGFAPPGSGLKAKARVNAVIDEAAVVIALAG